MEEYKVIRESYRKRALEDLKEAKLLWQSHLHVGAISRSYYACLHAIHFLLAKKGIQTKSHKQSHAEFRKLYVKDGPFSKKESLLITSLFNLRQNCDYDPLFQADPKEIEELLKQCEEFVDKVCR